MFGSSILEVAIGIVFVYLLMSLICSAVNEIIESVLRNRATDLENGIWNLLNQGDARHLTKKLYDHPLVSSLFNGRYDRDLNEPVTRLDYLRPTTLPSYIPARNFAQAVVDIMLHPPSEGGARPVNAAALPVSMSAVRDALRRNLGDTQAGVALRALAEQSGEDLGAFREGVETWFNSAMDRVSGAYTRRTKWLIFGLGFVLTVFLNVNTVTIARALANDRTMREMIVARAGAYADGRAAGQGDAAPAGPRSYEAAKKEYEENKRELQGLGLPIGWPNGFDFINPLKRDPTDDALGWNPKFNAYDNLWLPLIGWLLTAGAISMGAPFWFDLLNKLMVVRATVKPHEKSREEGSEDRQVGAERERRAGGQGGVGASPPAWTAAGVYGGGAAVAAGTASASAAPPSTPPTPANEPDFSSPPDPPDNESDVDAEDFTGDVETPDERLPPAEGGVG